MSFPGFFSLCVTTVQPQTAESAAVAHKMEVTLMQWSPIVQNFASWRRQVQLTEANLIMKAGEGEEEIGGERNGSVGGRKTEKK